MRRGLAGIFGEVVLLLAAAAPASRACELCRDSAAAPMASAAAMTVPPQARFNGSVLGMLVGTLAMAGFAGGAVFHAARTADRSDRR